MTNEITFRIPADFVLARAIPTCAELAYGFRHGWLRPEDVVAIELAKLKQGLAMNSKEEELALLLPGDFEAVGDLIRKLENIPNNQENPAALWIYLCLAWLFENRSSLSDPLGIVEVLYADFDYPEQMEEFIRYMPLREGQEAGVAAIYDRWEAYVARQAEYYKHRGS
jgi:hypothetical protein